jgi:ribosome biogenesis GTPase A
MISAKKKQNIESVLNKIFKIKDNAVKRSRSYRERRINKIRDCYILGCASVGKSTFINAIKEKYLDDKKLITTSDQFQTTMDFIKVYIDEDNYIIDTPGLINYRSFGAYLDYDSMKMLMPKSYLKPRTYQLHPDQTIFMGGLAGIDFIKGDKINVSFYTSNDLYIHRTKTINASNIYETQITKLLVPPHTNEELERLSETKEVMFDIEDGAYDLLISGLGFVHIVGSNIAFKVRVHKNIDVRLVETFI